jgi:hypothetical protein
MRTRVRFAVLLWRFFIEGEVSHDDHGSGSLVEFRFKAPSCTSSTIYLIGKTEVRPISFPTTDFGYISATTGRGDHDVYMDMWRYWRGDLKKVFQFFTFNLPIIKNKIVCLGNCTPKRLKFCFVSETFL